MESAEILSCSCSLERLIGFIVEVNKIIKLQFIIYLKRERNNRFQISVEVKDEEIFTYSENIYRKIFAFLPIGEAIYSDWLSDYKQQLARRPDENLGITSLVKLADEKIRHIPMIDFRCPCSSENLRQIREALFRLEQKRGFVLESGQSYHYYGIDLMDVHRWVNFMEQCKEIEIIGEIWPTFQLDDGYATLRIAASSVKPYKPKVIGRIGNFEF